MAKYYVLGFEPPARLEQVGDQDCRGVQNYKHQPSKCDDSKLAAADPDGNSGRDEIDADHGLTNYLAEII